MGEVPRGAGEPARHCRSRNPTDTAAGVDRIWTDEELLRLTVNQPVGVGAADALGTDSLPQIRRDLVEPVRGFLNEVRAVGDGPQPTGPRNDRAGAAFALIVEHRQRGIYAGDLMRRVSLREGCGACGDGCRDELSNKDAARRHRVRSLDFEDSPVNGRPRGAPSLTPRVFLCGTTAIRQRRGQW